MELESLLGCLTSPFGALTGPQAAIHATQLKRKHVTLADMEWAKDKILMGLPGHFGAVAATPLQATSASRRSSARRSAD